jgi:hypothetical protein
LGAKVPSRRGLYAQYKRGIGNELSWGAFSNIVKGLEKSAPEDPFSAVQWEPWPDTEEGPQLEETPEETDFLLKLDYIKQVERGVSLYSHEAKWGRRLRVALKGLPPYGQYRFVSLYATREVINHYLNRPKYTADLDAFIAFKPWRPYYEWVSYNAYLFAVQTGIIPFPELDPRVSLGNSTVSTEIPGVQLPKGPGPTQDPNLALRLRNTLIWILDPQRMVDPDQGSDPQKLALLRFWSRAELEEVPFHEAAAALVSVANQGKGVSPRQDQQPVGIMNGGNG